MLTHKPYPKLRPHAVPLTGMAFMFTGVEWASPPGLHLVIVVKSVDLSTPRLDYRPVAVP
jgi:hypothetical protein